MVASHASLLFLMHTGHRLIRDYQLSIYTQQPIDSVNKQNHLDLTRMCRHAATPAMNTIPCHVVIFLDSGVLLNFIGGTVTVPSPTTASGGSLSGSGRRLLSWWRYFLIILRWYSELVVLVLVPGGPTLLIVLAPSTDAAILCRAKAKAELKFNRYGCGDLAEQENSELNCYRSRSKPMTMEIRVYSDTDTNFDLSDAHLTVAYIAGSRCGEGDVGWIQKQRKERHERHSSNRPDPGIRMDRRDQEICRRTCEPLQARALRDTMLGRVGDDGDEATSEMGR
ncbi:hypothetical protein PM082_010740 [Marasmius tenuissimus]|nr:hypothetical protein PM082_010740 [Marasmius tenuissimus]